MEYNVSSDGIVTNKNGKVIKPRLNKANGYLVVNFYLGKVKTFSIHRLVAEKYVNNPHNLPEVNHIDGNKLNNNDWNLEWCTRIFNNNHAIKTGLIKQNGIDSSNSKLTEKDVLEIRSKYIPYIYHCGILAKEYSVSEEQIRRIIKRERWTHI